MADIESKPEPVSTDAVDQLLQQADPEFAKSLEDLKSGPNSTDVEIESLVDLEGDLSEEAEEEKTSKLVNRFPFLKKLSKPKMWLRNRLIIFKARAIASFWSLLLFLKTQPIEYVKYTLGLIKKVFGWISKQIERFFALTLWQKALLIFGIACVVGAGYIVKLNMHGVWLPSFQENFLTSFDEVADSKETFEPRLSVISFSKAFPQPEEKFLFNKVVVNLKRVEGSTANPMGAFEFWVSVDSKETAIELSVRQKELLDSVARGVEDLTYRELEGEVGQKTLRTVIRNELNRALSQGYVQDVYLKMMILKP